MTWWKYPWGSLRLLLREGSMGRSKNKAEHEKHGGYKTPEYDVWAQIKRRCNSPSVWNYHNYGGRGISYCERWEYFSNFMDDMGPRPSPRHQIDRIDVNGDYNKDNCRWALPSINSANRRRYSKCLGAYKVWNKFVSIIYINKRRYILGKFDKKEDAQSEYCKIYKEWYGFNPPPLKES